MSETYLYVWDVFICPRRIYMSETPLYLDDLSLLGGTNVRDITPRCLWIHVSLGLILSLTLLMYCGPCTSLTRNGSQLCRVEIIFRIYEKSLGSSCSYLSFVLFSCLKFYAKMRICILYSIYILIYDVQWICMLIWYVLLLGNLSLSIWLWLIF